MTENSRKVAQAVGTNQFWSGLVRPRVLKRASTAKIEQIKAYLLHTLYSRTNNGVVKELQCKL